MASVDYFLKIKDIAGESADSKHKDEIDVLSFSWGAQNSGTMSFGGGGGAGKVSYQDFHFSMRTCKATPKLMLKCSNGEHISEATFIARKAGKEQQEFLKILFNDIIISSYQLGGSQGDMLGGDSVAFNFSKVTVDYRPQKADGTLDGPVSMNWSVKQNEGK